MICRVTSRVQPIFWNCEEWLKREPRPRGRACVCVCVFGGTGDGISKAVSDVPVLASLGVLRGVLGDAEGFGQLLQSFHSVLEEYE
jgi:hypothetical protein